MKLFGIIWLVCITTGLGVHALRADQTSLIAATPHRTFEATYPIDEPPQNLKLGSVYPLDGETSDYFLIVYPFLSGVSHVVRIPKESGGLLLTQSNDGMVEILVPFEIDFEGGSVILDAGTGYEVVEKAGNELVILYGSGPEAREVPVPAGQFTVTRTLSSGPSSSGGSVERSADQYLEDLNTYLERHPKTEYCEPVEKPVDAICILESTEGTATGFLLFLDGHVYCVTNHHTLGRTTDLVIKTSDDREFTPLFFEIAEDRDLARILISESPPAFTDLGVAELGDSIRVLGNRSGLGVVRIDEGKVIGHAPRRVEVDAAFVAGNSGSPVLNEAGEVVGIATYLISTETDRDDWAVSGEEVRSARRFATSLDDSVVWIPIHPRQLANWAEALGRHTNFIKEVADLVKAFASTPSKQLSSQGVSDPKLLAWIRQTNGFNTRIHYMIAERQEITAQTVLGVWRNQIRGLVHIAKSRKANLKAVCSSLPELGYYPDHHGQLLETYDLLIAGLDYVVSDITASWLTDFD